MSETRRRFLIKSCGALAGSAALAAGLERFGLVGALARSSDASDYKALVCVFLEGGNDGNNTVVPLDEYDAPGGYAAVRASSGLAVPRASLLPVSPPSQQGLAYGFHPSLVELQALFKQGRLAVLCNAGTLVRPLTRTLYRSGVGHPYQLFSHPDQLGQQQACVSAAQTGWGGRVADLMAGLNGSAPLLPMNVSVAGASLFTTGELTRQLVINPGLPLHDAFSIDYGSYVFPSSREAAIAAFNNIRKGATGGLLGAAAEPVEQAARARQAIPTDPVLPPLEAGQTDFPPTPIGFQLRQVAKLISLRAQLGVRRQIFFCLIPGFDHHSNQHSALNGHGVLLLQLSKAMKAFHDATVRLGVADSVTTFTLSDFGRTLDPSGSGAAVGSDHAWGSHHLIMGGAVRGGDFYGTFPALALGGPDDADDRGRWIPTTSTEQYAATLALWFGLPEADLPAIFPLVGRFETPNLGFMS